MTPRTRRGVSALTAALTAAALAPAGASAADVTASKLRWSMVNQYDTSLPSNTNRTWLGYVLNSGVGPQFSNGTATVSDGATLEVPAGWVAPALTPSTIDGTAPEGLDKVYTFGFPGNAAGRGTYDPATAKAELEFAGTLAFTVHGLGVNLQQPKVVLDGTKGTLTASGLGSPDLRSIVPYDRTNPILNLDLSDATVTAHVDGSETISGIVPSVASTHLFSAAYPVGAGPNRSPNTFGSLSIRVAAPVAAAVTATPVAGPQGPIGPQGPAGPQGPKGDAGTVGTGGASTRARTYRYTLAKAPFGSKAAGVTVMARKGARVRPVTVGTVKGRTLRVKTSLSRSTTYRLVRTNRFVKQRAASIRVR